jgi:hypothetical protein
MRSDLALLRGKRVRFSATFAGKSKQGHVILSDVRGPVGYWHHLWVPDGEWTTFFPQIGKHVELVARVDTYQRGRDNSVDYGLFACREIRG